jgi:cold-inducible RNA-binding protein
MKNVYVGNFSFSTTEAELRAVFERYGAIQNVNLVRDQYTGKPRGFAFIEMTDDVEAAAAITAVNGSDLGGRALVVNEARPKTERGARSGWGGGKRTGSRFGGGRRY